MNSRILRQSVLTKLENQQKKGRAGDIARGKLDAELSRRDLFCIWSPGGYLCADIGGNIDILGELPAGAWEAQTAPEHDAAVKRAIILNGGE